jgi:transcriptional regulator GlxA family with amidase domain
LVVAGGSPQLPLPEDHAQTVGWLRRHKRRLGRVASICTGAFLLAEAGFLESKRATTHWLHLHDLRRRFPSTAVVDEGVYVEDGDVWTSAGVTAGIDLALALVEADLGHATAMAVAKRMVLFLRRSGRQSQFSSALDLQTRGPSQLSSLSAFILDHLGEPLPVERLASAAGMSPRTLSRWCREHFNESPAELVRRLRLEEARRLLAESELTIKEVAAQTGLGDPSTLWRAFTQQLAVTPAEYRQRFGVLAAVATE